jgi:hypothetical protein
MIYVVHPSVGLCPPTDFFFFIRLQSLTFFCSCALSHRAKLHTRQVICALSTRSTFPKSGQGTRANSSIKHRALHTQSVALRNPKLLALSLASYHYILSTLHSYLFILLHLQKGLIMGKPMGRHPITHYKTLRTPCWVHKAHKTSEIHDLSSPGCSFLDHCRSPKSGQT